MSNSEFFESLGRVRKAVSGGGEPTEVLRRLANELTDSDVQREFWRLLDDPRWIAPLIETGYLDSADKPVRGTEQREPLNIAGLAYLRRVAARAPEQVTAEFLRFSLATPQRLGLATETAAILPISEAVKLTRKITEAIQSGVQVGNTKEIARLVNKLASEGQSSASIAVLKAVWQAVRGTGSPGGADRPDMYYLLKLIEETAPDLLRAAPHDTLDLLFGILRAAVQAKGYGRDDPLSDLSYMWRPAIEEHEQNRTHDFAGSLVSVVREAIEQVVVSGALEPAAAAALLDKERFLIFKRLRLHLINRFADQVPDLARDAMLSKDSFDDHRLKHEYARLVEERFNLLDAAGTRTFFGWLEAGPDLERFRKQFASNIHRAPQTDEEQARARYWRYERLWWIRDHLDAKWAQAFAEMRQQYGEPKLADLNVRTSVRFGAESPIPPDALRGKDIAEIAQYLSGWEPNRQVGGPSREGLSGTFATTARESPERFASGAMLFRGTAPIYVRTLIDSIRAAVEQDQMVDLNPVLDLCKWVVDQRVSDEDDDIDQGLQGESGWQYTRDAVGRFIETLCKKKVPLEYRDRVWSVLPSLTTDSDRSYVIDSDTKEDLRRHDFTTQSLNTPRSRAIHAVIEYARWVHDQLKDRGDLVHDFRAMREVRDVLERELDPPRSRSFAVRSTFGWWFIPLYVIDKGWVTRNASRIFDLGGTATEPSTGWAAWNTYLIAHQIYEETYEILKSQYQKTVELLPELIRDEEPRERPLGSMGEHLIVLYGRGTLTLESDGAIVRKLFENSNSRLRSHVMTFVGRSLMGYGSLEPEVRERFVRLWEWYWNTWGRSTDSNVLTGYEFGTWAGAGVFDAAWSLRHLREFAEAQPKVEPDNFVVEYVAKVFPANPADAIGFVELFVRGDTENWRVYSSKDEIFQILRQGMQAEFGTRDAAVQVIDYLGRKGYLEFGDLLRSPSRS